MMRPCLLALAGVLALAGCGEIDQSKKSASKIDAPAYQGGESRYMVKGWTPGDKASWQAQMRTRGLRQNEYNRIN
jgi:hypothetical protein